MLQSFVDEFITILAEQEPIGAHTNTAMAYRNDLNQLCGYLQEQGIEEWSLLRSEHIADYLLVMQNTFSYRPTTIARKVAAYKSFFRYLQQNDVMVENLIAQVETPRIEKEPPQFLSVEQIQLLFAQVDMGTLAGQRDMAILHLLLATGMRASEIVSLDLEDVHIQEENVVYVGRSHDEKVGYPEHTEQAGHVGKGRILPLSATVVEVLSAYIQSARPRLARYRQERALFLNHHGERLTRQGFWLIIKGYARSAHIETLTPHMLRHSFAMLLLQEGRELRSVQELLGHAHISTTQVYNQFAHVNG